MDMLVSILFKKLITFFKKNIQKHLEKLLLDRLRQFIISKSINNLFYLLFNNWFVFSLFFSHKYNTSWSSNDKLQKYSYRTNTYGKNSIIISEIESWNNRTI